MCLRSLTSQSMVQTPRCQLLRTVLVLLALELQLVFAVLCGYSGACALTTRITSFSSQLSPPLSMCLQQLAVPGSNHVTISASQVVLPSPKAISDFISTIFTECQLEIDCIIMCLVSFVFVYVCNVGACLCCSNDVFPTSEWSTNMLYTLVWKQISYSFMFRVVYFHFLDAFCRYMWSVCSPIKCFSPSGKLPSRTACAYTRRRVYVL